MTEQSAKSHRRAKWENDEMEVLMINGSPFNCQLCGKFTRVNQIWFFWKRDGSETRTCSECGIKLAADHGLEIADAPEAKATWYRKHNLPQWEKDLNKLMDELADLSYQHAVFAIDKPEHTPRREYLAQIRAKRHEIIDLFWEVGELALDMTKARYRRPKTNVTPKM